MNAGRLNAALAAIQRDYEKNQIVPKLQELVNTLSNSISSSTEQNAIAFNAALSELYSALDESPSNSASQSRLGILEEIRASNKVGLGLRKRIQKILETNNVTPANALAELQKLLEELLRFAQIVTQMVAGFEELRIKYDDLGPGETEIGITVPFLVVSSNLEGVGNELHEFDKALKIFGELVEENPTSPIVKTIGSSALQIFLESTPAIALCIATALERLCALYKQILEIKLLRKKLGEQSLPEKVTEPIEAYERQIASKAIEKIANDLVKEFSSKRDKARENELKNGVRRALRFLAEQIDKGVDMEVRSEPPTAKAVAESEGESVKSPAAKRALEKARTTVTRIQNAGQAMRALVRAKEPILALDQGSEKQT
jgi:hypothetical protein